MRVISIFSHEGTISTAICNWRGKPLTLPAIVHFTDVKEDLTTSNEQTIISSDSFLTSDDFVSHQTSKTTKQFIHFDKPLWNAPPPDPTHSMKQNRTFPLYIAIPPLYTLCRIFSLIQKMKDIIVKLIWFHGAWTTITALITTGTEDLNIAVPSEKQTERKGGMEVRREQDGEGRKQLIWVRNPPHKVSRLQLDSQLAVWQNMSTLWVNLEWISSPALPFPFPPCRSTFRGVKHFHSLSLRVGTFPQKHS